MGRENGFWERNGEELAVWRGAVLGRLSRES